MACCINYTTVFVVLSILCDTTASSSSNLSLGGKLAMMDRSRTSSLATMLTDALDGADRRYLRLLYDQLWEDEIVSIAQSFISLPGSTIYRYDSTIDPLLILLTPAAEAADTILLLLCSSEHILYIFRMIHRQRLDSQYVGWLLITKEDEDEDAGEEDTTSKIISGLEGIILEGTQVTLVIKASSSTFIVFSSRVDADGVVRLYNHGKIDLSAGGAKDHLSHVARQNNRLLYSDMGGRELTVAGNDNFGFCTLGEPTADGTVVPISGIDLVLVKALSQALNFTYKLKRPADGLWGNPLRNGTITGMIGMVARREADFATCFISVTRQRETVVDFTYPYYQSTLAIFSRAPKQKNRALAVLSPFTLQVWIAIVIATLAMGPILTVQSRATGSSSRRSRLDLQWCSFNMFRSLVIQGNAIKATDWSTRMTLLSWFFFCIVISASYSGMLTAVLAIPVFEKPVDSLTDLPRAISDGFTLGVKAGTNVEHLFKDAKEGIYERTWTMFDHGDRSKSFVKTNVEGMDRVLNLDFLLIGMQVVCEILTMTLGKERIHIGRKSFFPHGIAVPVPSGAPYNKVFSEAMMRMGEGGLISKWKEDEISKLAKSTSTGEGKSRTYAITLTHLQAAFFVIFLGTLVAAVVLVMEIVVAYCQSS